MAAYRDIIKCMDYASIIKKVGPQKYCITSEVLNLLVWRHRHRMVSSSSHIVSKAHGVKAGDLGGKTKKSFTKLGKDEDFFYICSHLMD